jgi:hypothetical protein
LIFFRMSLRQEKIITATFFVLQFIVVASGKLTYGKLKVLVIYTWLVF